MGWADWFSWGQLQHRIYTGSRGSAPLKREINHCLSFSGNGYKSPGCADLQSLMEQFLLSLSPVLSITLSCFLLSLSFSLLALYFLDVSTCRCLVLHLSLLAVLHSVLFFFFFSNFSSLFASCPPPLSAFLSYDVFSIQGLSLLHHRPVCFTELQREKKMWFLWEGVKILYAFMLKNNASAWTLSHTHTVWAANSLHKNKIWSMYKSICLHTRTHARMHVHCPHKPAHMHNTPTPYCEA